MSTESVYLPSVITMTTESVYLPSVITMSTESVYLPSVITMSTGNPVHQSSADADLVDVVGLWRYVGLPPLLELLAGDEAGRRVHAHPLRLPPVRVGTVHHLKTKGEGEGSASVGRLTVTRPPDHPLGTTTAQLVINQFDI